jgi:hypothetical protein
MSKASYFLGTCAVLLKRLHDKSTATILVDDIIVKDRRYTHINLRIEAIPRTYPSVRSAGRSGGRGEVYFGTTKR